MPVRTCRGDEALPNNGVEEPHLGKQIVEEEALVCVKQCLEGLDTVLIHKDADRPRAEVLNDFKL